MDAWGHWYFFRNGRWRRDDRQEHFTLGREFLSEMADEVLADAGLLAPKLSKEDGRELESTIERSTNSPRQL